MGQMVPHLRVYGDNIIECERAMRLIADAFDIVPRFIPSTPNIPRYALSSEAVEPIVVELLPGHGRWGVNIYDILRVRGALLRESTDFIVTRLSIETGQEDIIFAGEFCSALPAGNNAWQRQGRAFSCASAGIPYLYYAELGGLELTEERSVKSARFPNPIIPFSYAVASKMLDSICLPVYAPNPSTSESIKTTFKEVFGTAEGLQMVKSFIVGTSSVEARISLSRKALEICEILSLARRSIDTLRSEEWDEFYQITDINEKADWLERIGMKWQKRMAEKVIVTNTFRSLFRFFTPNICIAVGASEIPICLVPSRLRPHLSSFIASLYQERVGNSFISWLEQTDTPLLVVWITGFKPQGEDSRPDRGLLPLARMLFGSDVPVLSVISGPAKSFTWNIFRQNRSRLSEVNGLWETVLNLSDGIIVDTITNADSPFLETIDRPKASEIKNDPSQLPLLSSSPVLTTLTEHDVDSTLHLVFSQAGVGVFESMCNPPGGDWSGLSVTDFDTSTEYRWTSLPRVSGPGTKRPDHVFQFRTEEGTSILFCVESKDRANRLELNVGDGLKQYVNNLLTIAPICMRQFKGDWNRYQGEAIFSGPKLLSGGAFLWSNEMQLEEALKSGGFDIVIGVELNLIEQKALLHIKTIATGLPFVSRVRAITDSLYGRVEVQIH